MLGNSSSPNRLIHEKSPYLLQHAHNPVDWYPWGKEAFEKARKEDKPIFLSIGYSTCHWCHVMERESFSDPSVARVLNEHFVAIKVDREERPDVDQLYMQAVVALSGQGGWPANLFLTPTRKPFYAGTYFPPEDRWGRPGLKSVLLGIAQAWKSRRQELLQTADHLTRDLEAAAAASRGSVSLTPQILREAASHFSSVFDERYGGFGSAPKFPMGHSLSFLLRAWKRFGDPSLLSMAEKTLQGMHAGGMFDHLGGGFHRYSTDPRWHIPHFEKMLYDQALLARAALEIYQATGDEGSAGTAREIFEYLLQDLQSSEGGFYSAEDADSLEAASSPHKKEGAFYVWTRQEIDEVLGKEAELFEFLYGVEPGGNAREDPQGEFKGKNILFQARSLEEAAKRFKLIDSEVARRVREAKGKLLEARDKRPRPHLDDKVLVDWNGLAISSLAFGSRVLEEPRYEKAARGAAEFVLQRLVRKDGRLLHLYRGGAGEVPGTLEDYAFFVQGLLDLYEAGFEARFLAQAKRLSGEMIRLFWDEKKGGFFLTGQDAEGLLVRQKELDDGAIPSGNSIAALVLLRLGRLTADSQLEKRAGLLFESFSGQVAENPSATPQFLIALDFALGPSKEIVIAGPADSPETQAMIRAVYQPFIPNKVVAFHADVPYLQGQSPPGGRPTVYVCQNYACSLPATSIEELQAQLKER
ncbi:MAG: thioredoxin domain-containing protein [Candidatus Omnitrophica bacterium]|nr:thioredoxin domain-containing protein [Candidatus Omnitrophota bacterium]